MQHARMDSHGQGLARVSTDFCRSSELHSSNSVVHDRNVPRPTDSPGPRGQSGRMASPARTVRAPGIHRVWVCTITTRRNGCHTHTRPDTDTWGRSDSWDCWGDTAGTEPAGKAGLGPGGCERHGARFCGGQPVAAESLVVGAVSSRETGPAGGTSPFASAGSALASPDAPPGPASAAPQSRRPRHRPSPCR